MRRPLIVAVTGAAVAALAGSAVWAGNTGLGRAQPPGGDVSGSGLHLTASVDNIGVTPPGDRTPNYLMTFSHATQVSGNYSVTVDGGAVSSGQAVAGFILGCGISVAGGVSVGIEPNQELDLSISPTFTPPSADVAPPGVGAFPGGRSRSTTTTTTTTTAPPSGSVTPPDFSLGPSIGGALGLGEALEGNLGPGEVTTATTATATLDGNTTFPFHLAFNNAALNVSQCASPVSAVPFVSASVSTASGLVQTTAYGDQFTF
ncbi:MspA family porin [Nocardia spumae]|uniref:MspA family porin n=1 Tax=Nocardia spumae TaxID=2887190 RepID=UPI001D15D379|nr:MspA family porin [Nocardia spumae]